MQEENKEEVCLNVEEIIHSLYKHSCAWPFNVPVDPVLLGIYDYYEIISHPMDFGTIKTTVQKGGYNNKVDQFIKDVNLVLNNARLYNQPDSDIYKMADTLQAFFNELISKAKNLSEMKQKMNHLSINEME